MNISLRIDDETMNRLDRAAKALDRPRSWVAMEALDQFLSYLSVVRTFGTTRGVN